MLSIGRVQTPVLAMVVEREKKILNHIKTPFWKLFAKFTAPTGEFIAEYEKVNLIMNQRQNKYLQAALEMV